MAVALALRDVHSEAIHRDLKPDNVLLDGDEQRVLLADLGICFVKSGERLTRSENETLGTDDFVAPELEGGGKIDDVTAAVDIYSLGKTFYSVLTGGDVFPRERMEDPKWDLLQRFPDDFAMPHAASIVRRLVRADPHERPSIEEVIALFGRVRDNIAGGVAYTDGMYDAESAPPRERILRWRRALASANEASVRPLVVAAVEDTSRAIETLLDKQTAKLGAIHAVSGMPFAMLLPIANEVSESILALQVPLLEAGHSARHDECLASLSRPLRMNDGLQYEPKRMAYVGGYVAASVILGALAWRSRSAPMLAGIVSRYAERSQEFSHLEILGNGSLATLSWISDVAGTSVIVGGGALRLTREAMDRALAVVHGLAVLKWSRSLTPERLVELASARDGISEDSAATFPAFYFRSIPPWLEDLANTFTDEPAFEEEVATAVLAMSAPEMRDLARRASPSILRAGEAVARAMSGPGIRWVRAAPGLGSWKRWCGGDSRP